MKITKSKLQNNSSRTYKNSIPQIFKINIFKYNTKTTFLIMVLYSFAQILSSDILIMHSFSNIITLKIRKKGNNIKILSDSFSRSYYPQKIKINDKIQNDVSNKYNFIQKNNIINLIWDNNINSCSDMFNGCFDISEIDVSEFASNSISETQYMFKDCSSLTSINLNHFSLQRVSNMIGMFEGCSSLTSLNLKDFGISNQGLMLHYLFKGCSSLSSLDLSSFNSPRITEVENMFNGCIYLEYINLKNIDGTRLFNGIDHYTKFLEGVPDNVVIYDNNQLGDIIYRQINTKKCKSLIRNNNWKQYQKKIIYNTGDCTNSCKNEVKYKYEYNGKCYESCSKGYIRDEISGITFCKCELEKCRHCPPVALSKELCTECNDDYYQIENDPSNIGEYINCYHDPLGYYLDIVASLYKKCYNSCKACEIKGNDKTHNCLNCSKDFVIKVEKNNYINCNKNCSYYHYFDNEKLYYCTDNFSCPEEYPNLIKHKYECSKNIDIIGLINEIGKNDTILEYIEIYLTSEYYDTSLLDKGEEEILNVEDVSFTLSTTQNQNKNKTIVDFGECENILINKYNKTLYLKRIDAKEKDMNVSKIEYDVYCKINGTKLQKLDLSICDKSKITISIPVTLNESLDILNSSSRYYNDICYTTTSENNTDISINDRQKEFCNKNKMVCQEDCDFVDYDNKTKKALCSCGIKESSSSFANMKINKTKLLESFININNIANIYILKCFKILFSIEGILYNIGSYIIIAVFILHIISICIFYINQLGFLNKKIKEILFGLKYFKLIKNVEPKGINKKDNKKTTKKLIPFNKEIKSKNKNIINLSKEKLNKKNKKILKRINKKNKNKKINNKIINDKGKKLNINCNNNYINHNVINNNNIINTINFHKKNSNKNKEVKKNINSILNDNKIKKIKKIMAFNEEELNELSYDLAIKHDKRTYCEYYFSLLKTKHNFLFSFIHNNDYNSKIIKIDLFFIGFIICYTINAIFFNDDTMHNIYERNGEYDFYYELPKTIYSSLISIVINMLLKKLAISNNNILDFKHSNNLNNIMEKKIELQKKIRIKLFLYFIVSSILLLFFWYYISMFGAIYKNTQLHLIIDTFTSFGLSLIYPFGIYLLPGLFRIKALSNKKKPRKYLYNLSKLLQLI